MARGGDSFCALSVAHLLTSSARLRAESALGEMLDALLQLPLRDFVDWLALDSRKRTRPQREPELPRNEDMAPPAPKRGRSAHREPPPVTVERATAELCITFGRGGSVEQLRGERAELPLSLSLAAPCSTGEPVGRLGLKEVWRCDLLKCIDASPLVVARSRGGRDTLDVYVGSHAGLFLSVSLKEGVEHWRRTLPDRIESSAALLW